MTDYYIDDRATGAGDGSTPLDAWNHPDDITGILAGDTINFVSGSGPYLISGSGLNLQRNGTVLNPIKWCFNNCELTGGVNASSFQWNLSSSGSNEYYLTEVGGGNPSLSSNECLTIDNNYLTLSAEEGHTYGAVGNLSNLQAGVGDNDSLGFNTVYIRFDDNAPSSHNVVVSTIEEIIDTNWGHHAFYDINFTYTNSIGIRGRGLNWKFYRGVIAYVANTAATVGGGSGDIRLYGVIGYWTGHRFISLAASGGFIGAYNCTDWGAHLLGHTENGLTSGTVEIYNCICANNEAGAIDKKSASVTLNEGGNHFYPRMTASGGALGYVSAANWPTTALTDNPSSASTTEDDQTNLTDPLFVRNPSDTDPFNAEDFRLQVNSPAKQAGVRWWDNEPNPIGYDGEPISDLEPSVGAIQSKNTPNHPSQL